MTILKRVAAVAVGLTLGGLVVGAAVAGPAAATSVTKTGVCNAAYPQLCLTHEVDCKDIKSRNFTALPADPYKLDLDKDGVACEKEGGVLVIGPGEGKPSSSASASASASVKPSVSVSASVKPSTSASVSTSPSATRSPSTTPTMLPVTGPGGGSRTVWTIAGVGAVLIALGIGGIIVARRREMAFTVEQ